MEREEMSRKTEVLKNEYRIIRNYMNENHYSDYPVECKISNDDIMYFHIAGIESKMDANLYKSLFNTFYSMNIPIVLHIKIVEGKINIYVGTEKNKVQLILMMMKQQLAICIDDNLISSNDLYEEKFDISNLLVGDISHDEDNDETEYGIWDRIMRFSSTRLNTAVVITLSPIANNLVRQYMDIFQDVQIILEQMTTRQLTIRDERETISFVDCDASLKQYKELINSWVQKYDEAMNEGLFNCTIKVFSNTIWENEIICGSFLSEYRNISFLKPFMKVTPISQLGYNDCAIVNLKEFMMNERKIKLPCFSSFNVAAEVGRLSELPRTDIAGFFSNIVPSFGINRTYNAGLYIGDIICNGCKVNEYYIPVDDLNRHMFIPGMTGAGKTNTIKGILKKLSDMNVPWLVIEPAKAEYYEMFRLGVDSLSIMSAGSSEYGFYINPFEPINKNVPIQEHIDSLYASLMASFTWSAPMPYVMENALYKLYERFGFDIYDNSNNKGKKYPTIEALYWIIPEVVEEMNYEGKMKGDVISSVQARISTLRKGTKGAILNVSKSSDWEKVFNTNTVIELEQIKDNDTKSFIMSMVCILLREYRMQQVDSQLDIKHYLLIEEAHRLLKKCGPVGNEDGNSRAAGVEFFSEMLSELRAKGQGFIIADQIPEKLTDEVVRNTNLKIVHRLVSGNDGKLLGETMRCSGEQIRYMPVLKRGQAVVFSEGDCEPKLVQIPNVNAYILPNRMSMKRKDIFNICGYVESHERGCLYNESAFASFALITESMLDDDEKKYIVNYDNNPEKNCEEFCIDLVMFLRNKYEFLNLEKFWSMVRCMYNQQNYSLVEEYEFLFKIWKILDKYSA